MHNKTVTLTRLSFALLTTNATVPARLYLSKMRIENVPNYLWKWNVNRKKLLDR